MVSACAAPYGDLRSISALLESVDCSVAHYVEAAYRGLFGPFGWLGPVLTAALVIYVAIYAYQLITGRGSLSVSTLTGRFIAMGVVVALASNWAAYQTAFADVFFKGGDELAGMILRATSSDASISGGAVNARLDALFDELTRLASSWGHRAPLQTVDQAAAQTTAQAPVATAAPAGWTGGSAVNMLWFSALAFALGSAGVIIIAKIALGFLLALGPLFILFALFPQTRGLFEGWLRAACANLLVPLLTTLATAGALPIVEPLVATASIQQARGEIDNEPVFILAICALIFAGLVAYSVAMTGKLVAAWRLPEAPPFAPLPSPTAGATAALPYAPNPRISEMLVAIRRDAESAVVSRHNPIASSSVALRPLAESNERGSPRRTRSAYRGFGSSRTGFRTRPAT